MVRDRLKELQEAQAAQGNGMELEPVAIDIAETPYRDAESMDDFFSEIEEIRGIIDEIESNVADVKVKHGNLLLTPRPDEIMKQQLDDLTAEIRRKSNNVKSRLTTIDRELGDGPAYASLRIRKTQSHQLTRKFIDVMNSYNLAQLDYKERCKKNIQRQFMITGQKVEDEELEEMLEQGELSVFSQGIIAQTQQAKQSLQDIEARHADLVKLETSIRELNQMFLDMALLISSQGEMVDNIQHIVENTEAIVVDARKQVEEADKYQRKARHKKFMICICLAISALILFILLYRFLVG